MDTGAERLRAHLGKRADLEGVLHCAMCREETQEDLVACAQCAAPYHGRCWELAGGCAVPGCGAARGAASSPFRQRPDSRRFRWQPRTRAMLGAFLCMGFGAWMGGLAAVMTIHPQLVDMPDFAGPNCDAGRLVVARPVRPPPEPLEEIEALLDTELGETLEVPEFNPMLTLTSRVLLVDDEPGASGKAAGLPVDSSGGVGAILDGLEKAGEAQTICRPIMRVRSGEQAVMSVGGEGQRPELSFHVTPRVDAEGIVNMDLVVDIRQQFAGAGGKLTTGVVSKRLWLRQADGREGLLFLGPVLAPKDGAKVATAQASKRMQVVLLLTPHIENEDDAGPVAALPAERGN
jgi:hypothetical protein